MIYIYILLFRQELEGITDDPDAANYLEVADVQGLYGITENILSLVCDSE